VKKVALVVPLSVMLMACGGAAPTPDIPAIQTQAAQDVIATITALAPSPWPKSYQDGLTLPPTATTVPTPTATETRAPAEMPTPIARSPTPTPISPTPTLTNTPLPPPTPTSTPLLTPVPPTNTPTPRRKWNCNGDLYNCGNFSSCDEVMSYWNACPGDSSRLDGDKDGVPRESLCG